MKGIKKKDSKPAKEEKEVKSVKKPIPVKDEPKKKSPVKGFEEEDPDNDELDDLLEDDDIEDDEEEVEAEEVEELAELEDDEDEDEDDEEYEKPKGKSSAVPKSTAVVTKDSGFTVGNPSQIWVSCSAKVTTRQYENVDIGTGITITLPDGSGKKEAEKAREEGWDYCQSFIDEITTEIRQKAKQVQKNSAR